MGTEDWIAGSYALGAVIGSGATSEVYAGTDRAGRAVAIKILHAPFGKALELERTLAIDHPNVVRVLEVGRDATRGCYLVMERITGPTLAARLVQPLPELEIRRLGALIADGMAAAHAHGIVHRDLKPANIMLADDVPKILDFGIARSFIEGSVALATGPRIGTPAYMAPEQLTGNLIAPCVDIWALGVILFETATGRLPFTDFHDGRAPQLVERAPRVTGVSPALAQLIARCLDRDPANRPGSMTAIAAALREEAPERITQALDEPAPVAPRRRAPPWPWIIATTAIATAVVVWMWPADRGAVPILPPIVVRAAAPVVTPPVALPVPPTVQPTVVQPVTPTPHPRPSKPRVRITPKPAGESLD